MRRRVLTIAAFVSLVVTGCGASAGTTRDPTKPTLPQTFDQVDSVACRDERRTIEAAVDTFRMLSSATTTLTEDALVSEGYLRETSTWFDLAEDGSVVPAPGSRCE